MRISNQWVYYCFWHYSVQKVLQNSEKKSKKEKKVLHSIGHTVIGAWLDEYTISSPRAHTNN